MSQILALTESGSIPLVELLAPNLPSLSENCAYPACCTPRCFSPSNLSLPPGSRNWKLTVNNLPNGQNHIVGTFEAPFNEGDDNKLGVVRRVKFTLTDDDSSSAKIFLTADEGVEESYLGTTRVERYLGTGASGSIALFGEFSDQDYRFSVTFDESLTRVLSALLVQPLDLTTLSANVDAPPPPAGDPILNVFATTDKWGCNLGEMAATVNYVGGFFPNGYVGSNLVGSLLPNSKALNPLNGVYQTLFSARPDLQAVLRGSGSTLLEQTNNLNDKVISGLDDRDFYVLIIVYSTLKYFLAGLISDGNFNDKWLLRKYNACFLKKLGKSKFSYYLQFFTDSQYGLVGFDRFFKRDIDACNVCLN